MAIETARTLLDILSRLDKLESNPTEASSGVYTPTLFNVVNVAASTAYECRWQRAGNTVTVSGRVDIDPTAAAPTATELGISLPVASAFSSANREECAGVGHATTVTAQHGAIRSDPTNDRAEYLFDATSAANVTHHFTFTYVII